MSRTSRLLLAPAAALALLAFSPGTASAAPGLPDPLGALQDAAEDLPGALTGTLPVPGAQQTPAQGGGTGPAAAVPEALEDAAGSVTDALPVPLPGAPGAGDETGGTGAGTGGAEEAPVGGGAPAEGPGGTTPDPLAEGCDQVVGGLAGLSPELAELIGSLCEAAEEDPAEALEGLVQRILDQLLDGLEQGCDALLGLIDQGAATLGADAAPLRGLVEQLCALIPGEEPAPAPGAQPTHPAPVHPVAQPQQHPQPAVVPVAHSGGTGGGGQLAYTGVDPKPYLFGGVAALGLGAGLLRLGRRAA